MSKHWHGVWYGATCGLGTETCPDDESTKDLVHNHGYDPSCVENWSSGRPRGACLGPFPVRPEDLESPSSADVGPSATESVEGSQIPNLVDAIDRAAKELSDAYMAYDPASPPIPKRSTVAAEAQSAVYGERGKDYGHPRQNFADTAAIWTVLLGDRLSAPLTGEDVARCMVGLKLARDIHSNKRDNRVDGIGYFIALDRLITGD